MFGSQLDTIIAMEPNRVLDYWFWIAKDSNALNNYMCLVHCLVMTDEFTFVK